MGPLGIRGLMKKSLMMAPPSSTWRPSILGAPFLWGGCSGHQPRRTALVGAGALEFTAQSLVEKKAFSGKSSLQGSREEGEGKGSVD